MGTERTHEIDAVASDWLIRRQSGAWSAADQARLNELAECLDAKPRGVSAPRACLGRRCAPESPGRRNSRRSPASAGTLESQPFF